MGFELLLASRCDTYTLQAMSSVNPADYLRRFSSHLMLEAPDMRVRAGRAAAHALDTVVNALRQGHQTIRVSSLRGITRLT